MKKLLICLLLSVFLFSGCASYYQAHSQFAAEQSKAIQSSSNMLVREYDEQGRIKKEAIANPMAAWAATQMVGPKDPAQWIVDSLKIVAWPVAVIMGLGSIKDMATSNKGTTTTVNGNSNLTGNTAGQGLGNPVTTTTSTTQATETGNNQ